ncbi:DUF6232 family protein [Symbioplanes lichenis]|uniref:DUF6232 family protein n=1 Tax=Symbioplanes lichenis TaxID=1629072 RepID=UPI0027385A82|nr:DUF6232 family protein [Actinoplanes lichenis]
MTVYYRGPDPRRPELVITGRLVKVRVPGGWRVWLISELHDLGVVRRRPGHERIMSATGGTVILVALAARHLHGWPVLAVVVVLLISLAIAAAEHRAHRRRVPAQLRASYRGTDVVVAELPRRDLEAACRGLIRAIEHRQDTTGG